jgi:hypothetical protein
MMLQEEFNKITTAYENYIKNGGPKSSSDRMNYINTVFNSVNMVIKLLCISVNGVDVDSAVLTEAQYNKRSAMGNKLFGSQTANAEEITKPSEDITEEESVVINSVSVEDIPSAEEQSEDTTIITEEDTDMPAKETKTKKKTSTKKKAVEEPSEETKKTTTKKRSTKKTKKEPIEAEVKMKEIEDFVAGKTAVDIIGEELTAWGISSDSFVYKALVRLPELTKHAVKYAEVVDLIAADTGKPKGVISSAFTNMVKKADFSKTIYLPNFLKLTEEELRSNRDFVIEQLAEYCEPDE